MNDFADRSPIFDGLKRFDDLGKRYQAVFTGNCTKLPVIPYLDQQILESFDPSKMGLLSRKTFISPFNPFL